MASSRTLKLKILGDIDGLTKSLRGGQGGFKQFAKVAGLAIAGAAAAFGKMAIAAGEAASTANARIAQINESMGLFGAETQRVTDSLIEYAEATARATGMDTNSIKLTQAKLLTFKELAATADTAGGSFERATNAAIDMAAAGFGSAETNAVQLGKALNDPIKGITALTRSGITFTESEKQLIATMVESGNIMGAQEMILAAIETQVGGTAEATANASDKMNVAFQQLTAEAGEALLPAFEDFTTFVIESFIPAIESTAEWIAKNKDALALLAAGIAAVTLVLKAQAIQTAIVSGITKTQIALQAAWNAVLAANPIGLIVAALALLAAGFVYAWNNSETFRKVVIAVAKAGVNVLAFLIEAIGGVAEAFLEVTTGGLRLFLQALDAVGISAAGDALDFINNGIETVGDFFDSAAESVRGWNDSIDGWADNTISFFGDTSEAATDAKDVTAGAYEATAAAATASGKAQEKAAAGVSKATKKTADDVKKANDKMESAWLASAKAAKEAAKAAIEATWETLQGFKSTISDLKETIETIKQEQADAAESLAKAVEAAGAKFKDSIKNVLSLSDAAKNSGQDAGKSFMQSLLDQVAKGKLFAAKIKELISKGLSRDAIDQILAAGADTGTKIADEILSSNAVSQVNAAFASIKATANELGTFAIAKGYDPEGQLAIVQARADAAIAKAKRLLAEKDLQNVTAQQDAYRLSQILAGNIKVGEATFAALAPDLYEVGVRPSGTATNTYNVTVNGALDPEAVARQINGILQTSANRTGNYTNLGVGNLSLAGV